MKTVSTNVNQIIDDLAEYYQDRSALIAADNQALSYHQIFLYTLYINSLLSEQHISKEEPVAVIMQQGISMSVTCLSLMTGCIVVPINPAFTKDEKRSLLKKHAINHVITDQALAEKVNNELNIDGNNTIILEDCFTTVNKHSNLNLEMPSANENDPALILHTSGSTTAAKAVTLTHKQLIISAGNVIKSLQLDESDCCINIMPPFHIGAIVDLTLAPLMAGGKAIVNNNADAAPFWKSYQFHQATWFQTVPTMLQNLCDTANNNTFKNSTSLKFIRVVSSKLSESLANNAQNIFGVPVLEMYGMTEAAGLIASNTIQNNKSQSVGQVFAEQLMIMDQHGNQAKPDVEGEILIKGEHIISHYKETDEINRPSFINGWLKTGDIAYLDHENYLFITGRSKELINRGGEKISPLEIDNVLNDLDGVIEAAAFPIAHPTLGENVAAAIVIKSGSSLTIKSIQDELKNKLADYKLPQKIFFINELPRAAGGKLQRHKIHDLIEKESDTTSNTNKTTPDDDISTFISKEWQRILKKPMVYCEDNFFDLGGDSLQAATLMARLEKKYTLVLPTALLFDKPTLGELSTQLKLMQSNKQLSTNNRSNILPAKLELKLNHIMQVWPGDRQTENSLLNGFNTVGSLPPLFWSCQQFEEVIPIIDGLGADQPIYVMSSLNEIVKRKNRDYPQLAKRYLEEIKTIQANGPYYLGGYCGGAKLAHEIATQLISNEDKIGLLCLHEVYVDRPFPGRVAFFCSNEDIYSPFGLFNYPEMGIGQIYTGDVSMYRYDCAHAEFFRDAKNNRYAKDFVGNLQSELAYARETRPSPKITSFINHQRNYNQFLNRKISINTPRIMPSKNHINIELELTNRGNQDWLPTMDSGVTISARWLNIHNNVKMAKSGFCNIDKQIKVGEKHICNMTIETTPTSGLRRLEIDLLKEGIGWVAENNEPAFGKWIWVK